MITMYGIPNCDTIKKARRWLEQHGIDYRFHDYRKDGIDAELLHGWCRELSHEALINRRGTTWRKLSMGEREGLDETRAVQLMLANPSLIKRPLLDTGHGLMLGFEQSRYEYLL